EEMIELGQYLWERRREIPKCDSCDIRDATHKIYTVHNGIRLCRECLEGFYERLKRL
ncbi:unnamed protein product, partial [marine sediment metagenome]